MLAYVATISGIVVAIVGVSTPIVLALLRRNRDAGEEGDEVVSPVMGMQIPVDHTNDAYDMLKQQLAERTVEKAQLQTQLTDAYAGWRTTQSELDRANERIRELEALISDSAPA